MATTFEAAHNTIRNRFKTQVVDLITGGLPTQYDNEDAFEKPNKSHWCRLTLLPDVSFQATLGNLPRFRNPGMVVVQIFTPLGDGDKKALEIADYIISKFRAVTDTGVVFKTPFLSTLDRFEGEWQLNVTIPYYFDDKT